MQSLKKIHVWAQMQVPLSNIFLFLSSNKMLVIRGGIHKMLFRIAKEQSDLGLHWLGYFGRQLVSEILAHLQLYYDFNLC